MKTYYYETQYPNYLMHFGVKGMKWGVRNDTYEAYKSAKSNYKQAKKQQGKIADSAFMYGFTHPVTIHTSKNRKRELAKRYDSSFANYKNSYMPAKQSYESAKKNMRDERRSIIRNYTGSRKSSALNDYRHKNIDNMTNSELQEATNRMNLEKNYRSLTKMDFGKGKRFVDNELNYENTYRRVKKSELVKIGSRMVS